MLIDSTYFRGELVIKELPVNRGVPDETRQDIEQDLNYFIDKYEPLYLRNMFGSEMFVPLWDYIRNRDSFGDKIDKWEKVIALLSDGSFSPIAGYVYYYYTRSHQAVASANGVETEIDRSALASANAKMVWAWNGMVRQNRDIACWMRNHISDYPEWNIRCFMLETINEFGL